MVYYLSVYLEGCIKVSISINSYDKKSVKIAVPHSTSADIITLSAIVHHIRFENDQKIILIKKMLSQMGHTFVIGILFDFYVGCVSHTGYALEN